MNKRYRMDVVIVKRGQLEFALEKPKMVLYGSERYPELYQKAAAIMESVTKGHNLSDGNKRCGMMLADLMITVNGGDLILPLKSIRLSVDTAMDQDDLITEEIHQWFKIHTAADSDQLSIMLEEHVEEEEIIKTLLTDEKYDELEKLVSNWLAFDSYQEHKKAWSELVKQWKNSERQIMESKELVNESFMNPIQSLKSIIGDMGFDQHLKNLQPKLEIQDLVYVGHSLDELQKHEKRIKEKAENLSKSIDLSELFQKFGILNRFEKLDEALETLDKISEIDKEEPLHAQFHKAQIFLRMSKNLEDALRIGKKVLKESSNSIGTLTLVADILEKLKRYSEALDFLDAALAIDPNSKYLLTSKGHILYQLNRIKEAAIYFEKSYQIDPEDPGCILNMGIAVTENGDPEGSLKYFDKLLELNQSDYSALYNKGRSFSDMGKIDKAEQCYLEVLKINPNHISSTINMGSLLSNRGDYDEAIPYFNRGLELSPEHHVALTSMGVTLYNLGKPDEAIPYFIRSLKVNPDDYLPLYDLACIYSVKGDAVKALEYLEKSYELNKDEVKTMARQDDDFENIRDSNRFKKIIA